MEEDVFVRYLLLGFALSLGVACRNRIGESFRTLYRSQAAFLGAPLALLAGWSFEWRPTALSVLLCLLAVELTVITFAIRLSRRDRLSPVTAVASTSNSGFWSTPIAGALFGPPGAAFAVVYDIVGAVRPFLIVRTLRSQAPEAPSRRSALVDYLPATTLVVGLVLQLIRPIPESAKEALPWLALVLGVIGFFALGAAMPQGFPRREDFVAAAPVIPLRFLLPLLVLLALRAIGVSIPSGAWVVALAPNAFLAIAMARLYGYDRRRAAAIPILTVPIAAALIPLAGWLGR
jgi:predicted permease